VLISVALAYLLIMALPFAFNFAYFGNISARDPADIPPPDTTTKVETGPFKGSVDLGETCNDIKIWEPVQAETLDGNTYTDYTIKACDVILAFSKADNAFFDLENAFVTSSITSTVNKELIELGADKDTIQVFKREIDDKPGAVGSGYVPKTGVTIYLAAYFVSPKSVVRIIVRNNQNKMTMALKTINVTETA